MTGSDLLVVGPWIIFGICLAGLCIRLLRARRSEQRPPSAQRKDG